MKPKHSNRHIRLVLLGIPFLFLNPATHGKDLDNEKKAVEVAETKETAEEKGKARSAKEAAGRAEKAAEREKEAAQEKRPAAKPTQADEKAPARSKLPEPAPETPADESEVPAEPETAEKPDAPAKGKGRRESANKPPVDMPVVPAEPLKPRGKPPGKKALPDQEATSEPAPDKPADGEIAEIPATEPERLAETKVTEVTREVQRDLDQRKTRIEGRKEAQALIDDILGAESQISRAEIARAERFRARLERQRPDGNPPAKVSPDQRRAASSYFQQRLRGRDVEGPPPEFFRRSGNLGDRRDPRIGERIVERTEFVRPRYLNEGRRYVHFDSRAAIPAILMAAQTMNYVRFQPTREITPIFHERRDVSAANAMPLPPENYRSENSWVVSYPVDEKSMISSEDILFLQGSTQFSDPYSYEVIAVMAEAMKELPGEERFVIEGHASAEGSYEDNMVLSQQRAEHIVREIVRRGVSPNRLLPVGYGESEARHPADDSESLRGQDRRVVVFRMKPEPIAKR